MGAVEFGGFLAEWMKIRGYSQNRVARRFGELPDGTGLDSTAVRMLKEGKRRLDRDLVARLIEVMGWDEDPELEATAWFKAGLQDPSVSLDEYREIVSRRRRSDRQLDLAAVPPAASLRGPDANWGLTETGRAGLAAVAA